MNVLQQETATCAFQVNDDLQSKVTAGDRLNLGCGLSRVAEAVNLDIAAETHPDVVHDLNCLPWPFPDNHFREVLAYDVIEHLEGFFQVMEEIHRICRNGAVVRITVPHFSCGNAFADPTHRLFFSYRTFDYFTGENGIDFYTHARFRKRSSRMFFFPSFTNKLVWRLANRYPMAYELRWAWIFPAWYLYFELEVQK
jgi:SAM-dependent methyltransferase